MTRLGKARNWRLWILLTVSVALACGPSATFIVQQYNGPPLPAERIAILRLVGGDEGYLATLDGETLDYRVEARTDRIHIEILPGPHELGMSLRPLGLVSYRVFNAEPGKTYQPKILRGRLERRRSGQANWKTAVFEVDPDSGELLHDVSTAPMPAALEPVPTSPSVTPQPQPPAPHLPAPAPPAEPSAPIEAPVDVNQPPVPAVTGPTEAAPPPAPSAPASNAAPSASPSAASSSAPATGSTATSNTAPPAPPPTRNPPAPLQPGAPAN